MTINQRNVTKTLVRASVVKERVAALVNKLSVVLVDTVKLHGLAIVQP